MTMHMNNETLLTLRDLLETFESFKFAKHGVIILEELNSRFINSNYSKLSCLHTLDILVILLT